MAENALLGDIEVELTGSGTVGVEVDFWVKQAAPKINMPKWRYSVLDNSQPDFETAEQALEESVAVPVSKWRSILTASLANDNIESASYGGRLQRYLVHLYNDAKYALFAYDDRLMFVSELDPNELSHARLVIGERQLSFNKRRRGSFTDVIKAEEGVSFLDLVQKNNRTGFEKLLAGSRFVWTDGQGRERELDRFSRAELMDEVEQDLPKIWEKAVRASRVKMQLNAAVIN